MFALGFVAGIVFMIVVVIIVVSHVENKLDTFEQSIVALLYNKDINKGIEDAKTICRETTGKYSAVVYSILSTIQKNLKGS